MNKKTTYIRVGLFGSNKRYNPVVKLTLRKDVESYFNAICKRLKKRGYKFKSVMGWVNITKKQYYKSIRNDRKTS